MHEQGGLVVRVLALAQGFEETATIRLPLAVLSPAGAEQGGRRERAQDLEWECQAPAGAVSWCALLLACARVSLPFCTCVRMDVSEREVRSVMYRQQVYAANMLCVLVVFGVPLSLAGAVLAFCFRAWARGRGRGRAAARISETKKAS